MRKIFTMLMFIAALAGCQKTSHQNVEQGYAGTPQKITVAYTAQPESALVLVAAAKGYFADEALDAQMQAHTSGKSSLQAVIRNRADFATVAETPIMFNVLKGEKILVVANIETSTMNHAIVARKSAGISRPGDLKGKRVGFVPGTTSDFFLDSLLTANGLTRQEIHPVAMGIEEMQDAMKAKKVDAVSAWNCPLTQISRQLGPDGVIFYDREIYTETFNIAAMQDFVRNNPEAVKRFLRALIKAENFMAKNPDEAQAIVSAAIQVDKELIREIWSAFNYRVALDQMLLIALEDETRWAMKNKLTDRAAMPDYMGYIHLDSLMAVKPEAVRMNR